MNHWDILDFAVQADTGMLVDIRQVENGLRCGCFCPQCGRRLVARKGPRNRHHFSHFPRDQRDFTCTGGAETGLHRAAKQIIANWKSLMLPAISYSQKGRDRFGREFAIQQSIPGDFFPVESSALPDLGGWQGDWIPDVVLYGGKGELRIEIKVTNGISAGKQRKIDRDLVQTLEYDLAALKNDHGWNLDSLEGALRNDQNIVRWAFHPGYAALKERVRLEFEKQSDERSSQLIREAPVFGKGELVLHPWFGLVPKDVDMRQHFVEQNFSKPEEYALSSSVTIKIRPHALLRDSWLVSLTDTRTSIPRVGHYDSLLSEHLAENGYRSIYFGVLNMRVVRGATSHRVILDFVRQFAQQKKMGRAGRVCSKDCMANA